MTPRQLFNDNYNLVYFTIHKHFPISAFDEDIEQLGAIGLWKACLKYKPGIGEFSTFAVTCIRKEVSRKFWSDHYKKRSLCKVVYFEDFVFEDGFKKGFDIPSGRLSETEEAELRIDLDNFRKQLKPKERMAFDLLAQGYNKTEISIRLGVTPEAIGQRVEKIRNKARKAGLGA